MCQLQRYTVAYFIKEPGKYKNKTTEKSVKSLGLSPTTSERPQNPGEPGIWSTMKSGVGLELKN